MIRNLISNQFKSVLNEIKIGSPNFLIKSNNNNTHTLSNYYIKSCFSTRILSDKQKSKIRNEKKLKREKLKFEYNIPTQENSNNNQNNQNNENNNNFSFSDLINGGKPMSSEDIKNKLNIMTDSKSMESMDRKYLKEVNLISELKLERLVLELKNIPKAFFRNKQNHLMYIKYLTTVTKGIIFTNMATWYKFRRIDFTNNYGTELLKLYGDDHVQALISIFPSYKWQLWKFPTLNPSFWNNDKNAISYLTWFINKTKGDSKKLSSCYGITKKHFTQNYGHHLLKINQDSLPHLFLRYFPDYDWKVWLFDSHPEGYLKKYFSEKKNVKNYLLWIGFKILGYKSYEDFYRLGLGDLKRNYGLIAISNSKYKSSIQKFVSSTLDEEFKWEIWRFRVIPRHRRNFGILNEYINHLYKLLNCSTPEELIQIVDSKLNEDPTTDIIKITGGKDILNEFGGSLKSSFEKIENKERQEEEEEEEEEEDDEFDDLFEIDQKDEHIKEYEKDLKGESSSSSSSPYKTDKLYFKPKKTTNTKYNKKNKQNK
ncbi:hypothetical protein ACTFIR_008495 [Dictyostelium discoideum]